MADTDAILAMMMDAMADRMIASVRDSMAPKVIKENRIRALQIEKKIRLAKRGRDPKQASKLEGERRDLESAFLRAKYDMAEG